MEKHSLAMINAFYASPIPLSIDTVLKLSFHGLNYGCCKIWEHTWANAWMRDEQTRVRQGKGRKRITAQFRLSPLTHWVVRFKFWVSLFSCHFFLVEGAKLRKLFDSGDEPLQSFSCTQQLLNHVSYVHQSCTIFIPADAGVKRSRSFVFIDRQ